MSSSDPVTGIKNYYNNNYTEIGILLADWLVCLSRSYDGICIKGGEGDCGENS